MSYIPAIVYEPPIATGTTSQWWRGDKAWVAPPKYITVPVVMAATTVADSTTYYFGMQYLAGITSTGSRANFIREACTLKQASLQWNNTVIGTAENISIYVRQNNSIDALVQTVGVSAGRQFYNAAMNTTYAAGDSFEMKLICPAWATNPTAVIITGFLVFQVD